MGAPLSLLAGALLVVIAAAVHPHVEGDGPAQLTVMASSAAWHAIHWAFLFGFVLCLAGLAGVASRYRGTAGEQAAVTGTAVAAFAYAAWLVIVAFMAGSGATLADAYRQADPGMTATHAVFLYDMVRPFALVAQRVAAFALGITTVLFGWALLRAGRDPRWLGWTGLIAGFAGVALALAYSEATRADQAAFVLPVLWQVAAGLTFLAVRPAAG